MKKQEIRYSALFAGALITALAMAYLSILSGAFGLIATRSVGTITFGSAIIGGLAVLGYLIAGRREIERKFRRT